MNVIGKYIFLLRKERGFTLRQLKGLSDVNHSTISRIENSAIVPGPGTLKKLAAALEVDYVELLRKAGYLDDRQGYESAGSEKGREGYVRETPDDSALTLVKSERLSHIKDPRLRDWVADPDNIGYLKLAMKISDLDIEPEYVMKEFINRIFRKKGRRQPADGVE